jgi:hypothetical protein
MNISLYFDYLDTNDSNAYHIIDELIDDNRDNYKINGINKKFNKKIKYFFNQTQFYLPEILKNSMTEVSSSYKGKYYYPIPFLVDYFDYRPSGLVKSKKFKIEIPKNVVKDIKEKKAKILIINNAEGVNIDTLGPCIIDKLLIPYEFDKDDMVLLTANKVSNIGGFVNLYNNIWENVFKFHELEHNHILLDALLNIHSNNLREHKFICLQRRPRCHRLSLYAELYDVANEGILTLGKQVRGDSQQDLISDIGRSFPRSLEKFKQVYHTIPREYDVDLSTENPTNDHNIEKYQQSYLHIVAETYFYNRPELIFFSEKIYKPVVFLQPFILVGQTGSLAALKELGFKTFSDFIDESYDNIEDDTRRLYAAIASAKNFINKDRTEIHKLMKEMLPVLLHNYSNLKELDSGSKSTLITDLHRILNVNK